VFSYRAAEGYLRLVRRGRRWFVEYDGFVSRTFDTAQEAAAAAARGEAGLPIDNTPRGPADLSDWSRGDLPPVWPSPPPPGVRTIVDR
jgi:hypothetical protein